MGSGRGVVRTRCWWWRGGTFENARRGRGLGAKHPETERSGSVSGLLIKRRWKEVVR
jgi:hypothetical protein